MTRTRGKESLWFEINPRPGKSIRTNFEADAWNLEGHRDVDFERGKPIENWLGEGWFAASMKDLEGPIEDVLRTSNLLPVFSERCKRELEAHQISELQYLPVRIFDSAGRLLAHYYLVNILNNLPALDEKLSIVKRTGIKKRDGTFHDWIGSIENTTLRLPVIRDRNIFRLTDYEGPIFVSRRFREIFEKAGLTGWGFWPVRTSES